MHAFIISCREQARPACPGPRRHCPARRERHRRRGDDLGEGGAIAIQVNDDDGARAALQESGVTFREADVAAAWLENRPGTLADAARRLGDAGVNIEAFFPIGMEDGKVGVLFAVSDGAAAKAALGELTGAAAG